MIVHRGAGTGSEQAGMSGDQAMVVEQVNRGGWGFQPYRLAYPAEWDGVYAAFKLHMPIAVDLDLSPAGRHRGNRR